jgi:hypothetical protein
MCNTTLTRAIDGKSVTVTKGDRLHAGHAVDKGFEEYFGPDPGVDPRFRVEPHPFCECCGAEVAAVDSTADEVLCFACRRARQANT